jgi:hypothetical protein
METEQKKPEKLVIPGESARNQRHLKSEEHIGRGR